MPAAGGGDKARHVYGPRPLAALLPNLMRPVFARHPAATAQVIADWALIVGVELAAATLPRRLTGGTLTVACSGPVALELQHIGDVLIGRINQHLGHVVVQRLRLVHEAIQAAPRLPPPSRPDPKQLAAVERSLSDFAPGPLRDALIGLGVAVRRR